MEGSITTIPSSQPILHGDEKIAGPDLIKKSSRLRSFYSSKKYNNLRASNESIERLSSLNNVSTKKPEYIEKHIDLATNAISSALCSTNANVVQKSIEVFRNLSSNFYNELKDSYWLFYYVAINNLVSPNQVILDESLQLISDMHLCFEPEYFIATIKEIIPNAKKASQITSFLFCLYQLLLDCRKEIKSYCPTYIELLMTMKQCYKPLRKLCHLVGQLLNEVFSSSELKELIESNLNNDEHNIRKFCKLYGLHKKDYSVNEFSLNKSNYKIKDIYNEDNNNIKDIDYNSEILPSLLKSILNKDDDDNINNYNDYYDSDNNSVFSDSEKIEMIKDLLEESQEIVNKHEIRCNDSDIDVLLDRNSEVSTDDYELEFNENRSKSDRNLIKKNRMKTYDSSDDERSNGNKRSSTGSLNKNDIDYGLLCSDTDEMRVDTSLTADGRRRRPQSEKLLPISFDDNNNNNNNNNLLHHSKLNKVVNYRDLAPSPVEEVSLEDETSSTPVKTLRTISMNTPQPAQHLNNIKSEENPVQSPSIKELVKESEDLLEKTCGKENARKTSLYDELLNADRDSYIESDLSSGDVSRVEEEVHKRLLLEQLSTDDVNLRKDEENIDSILVDVSPVHKGHQPDSNPTPFN